MTSLAGVTSGSLDRLDSHSEPPRDDQRPLRIAYVVSTFGIGGAERCIARLANHLDRTRYEPFIICLYFDRGAGQWLEVDDVPVIELHKRLRNDMRTVRRLAAELKRHRIELVHSHNWGTLVETTVARFLARTPIHVHAERGMRFSDSATTGLRTWLRYRVMRWALNRAEAVVAVADVVRDRILQQCGRLKCPIYVVPNGVDVPAVSDNEDRRTVRAQLGIADDVLIMGSMGRLVEIKDFPVAVDALARLRGRGYNVHLLLVGDGPERQVLEELAREHEVMDRLHLVGHQEDVGAWYRAMDIYLNVSQSEGMSQAILEAMSLGLPMVVSDVGANASLAGGDRPCGLVVPAGNAPAVVNAIAQLADDPQFRHEMRENAVDRHRTKYSVQEMINSYDNLYRELAAANTR